MKSVIETLVGALEKEWRKEAMKTYAENPQLKVARIKDTGEEIIGEKTEMQFVEWKTGKCYDYDEIEIWDKEKLKFITE